MSKKVAEVVEGIIKGSGKAVSDFSNKPNATVRHGNDMNSDNWLSKSIRPLVVIWSLIILTVFMVLDAKGITISRDWILIVKVISISSIGFYFPSRLVEKYINGKRVFNQKSK